MPVTYEIFPDLNLIIYVCVGSLTPTKFYEVSDQVMQDPRLKTKMKIIIDFFNADIETTVSDIHLAISKYTEAKKTGIEVGQTAVYTKSSSLKFLGEALRQLSFNTVTDFGIFHNARDAIQFLNLPADQALEHWHTLEKQALY